jgi:predicted DNA-binding transcriptional regulator AlpA
MSTALELRNAISTKIANAHPDTLLTRNELSEALGASPRLFEQLSIKGEGPRPIKLGHRTVRYRAGDIRDWLQSLAK